MSRTDIVIKQLSLIDDLIIDCKVIDSALVMGNFTKARDIMAKVSWNSLEVLKSIDKMIMETKE